MAHLNVLLSEGGMGMSTVLNTDLTDLITSTQSQHFISTYSVFMQTAEGMTLLCRHPISMLIDVHIPSWLISMEKGTYATVQILCPELNALVNQS